MEAVCSSNKIRDLVIKKRKINKTTIGKMSKPCENSNQFYLHKIVVLPALSRPMMIMRIWSLPTRPENILLNTKPIKFMIKFYVISY
jgi:hypothetical protein